MGSTYRGGPVTAGIVLLNLAVLVVVARVVLDLVGPVVPAGSGAYRPLHGGTPTGWRF